MLMRCAGGARSNQAHRRREWLGVAGYTAAVVVTLASLLYTASTHAAITILWESCELNAIK